VNSENTTLEPVEAPDGIPTGGDRHSEKRESRGAKSYFEHSEKKKNTTRFPERAVVGVTSMEGEGTRRKGKVHVVLTPVRARGTKITE